MTAQAFRFVEAGVGLGVAMRIVTRRATEAARAFGVATAFGKRHDLEPNRGRRTGVDGDIAARTVALTAEPEHARSRVVLRPNDRHVRKFDIHGLYVISPGPVTSFTPDSVVRGHGPESLARCAAVGRMAIHTRVDLIGGDWEAEKLIVVCGMRILPDGPVPERPAVVA